MLMELCAHCPGMTGRTAVPGVRKACQESLEDREGSDHRDRGGLG